MNWVNSRSGSALLRRQHHKHCRGYYYYCGEANKTKHQTLVHISAKYFQLSTLFNGCTQQEICNKIPPHLRSIATLPGETHLK